MKFLAKGLSEPAIKNAVGLNINILEFVAIIMNLCPVWMSPCPCGRHIFAVFTINASALS
jgi:hypothetical protein